MEGYWAVAQTEPMRESLAVSHLQRAGYATYLPRIKISETKRIVPLFPSYAFVHIVDHWYSALGTIGVIRLLLAGDHPARVGEEIINGIKAQERGGLVKLQPLKPRLKPGDPVRVVRGSFLGHFGIYDGMSGKERERVLLELLGRKVRVEMGHNDVEPLNIA
jgi:transcriptional antiterminator RfaH